MHSDLNNWFFGWGWLLWLGFIFLLFSGLGNWGYSYSAHRKFDLPRKSAQDILDERYARGDLGRDQYLLLKADIAASVVS